MATTPNEKKPDIRQEAALQIVRGIDKVTVAPPSKAPDHVETLRHQARAAFAEAALAAVAGEWDRPDPTSPEADAELEGAIRDAEKLRDDNNLGGAIARFRQAAALAETALPRWSSVRFLVAAELGRLLLITKHAAEAESVLRRALRECETYAGPTQYPIAVILQILGDVLRETDRLRESLDCRERSTAVLLLAVGKQGDEYIESLEWLADAHRAVGETDMARSLIDEARSLARGVRGRGA